MNSLIRFNRHHFNYNDLYLIVGSQGKNHMIKDICYLLLKIETGLVISSNLIFEQLTNRICKKYSKELIDKYKKKQVEHLQQSLLIIDTNSNKKIIQDIAMKELFLTHGCYNISLLYTLTDLINTDVNLKNISYIFILLENDIEKRKAIFNEFPDVFENFNHFNDIMNSLTISNVLLIHNNNSYIFRSFMHYRFKMF